MLLQVEVEAEVDGWLHCISARGDKGLVPATYVRMLAPGEHAPSPASPPARSHSRRVSYDFFSQVRKNPLSVLPCHALWMCLASWAWSQPIVAIGSGYALLHLDTASSFAIKPSLQPEQAGGIARTLR